MERWIRTRWKNGGERPKRKIGLCPSAIQMRNSCHATTQQGKRGVNGNCLSTDAFHQPVIRITASEDGAHAVANTGMRWCSCLVVSLLPARTDGAEQKIQHSLSLSYGLPEEQASPRKKRGSEHFIVYKSARRMEKKGPQGRPCAATSFQHSEHRQRMASASLCMSTALASSRAAGSLFRGCFSPGERGTIDNT